MRNGRSYLICLFWHNLFYPLCFSRKTYVSRICVPSEALRLYTAAPNPKKRPYTRFTMDSKGFGTELRMGGV